MALAALASSFVGIGLAPASPVRAASSAVLPSAQALAIDPSTGRVFVVGGDRVAAFAADGTLLGVIDGIAGGYAIAAAGGYLWVPQINAASIAKIDPTTLAKVAEIEVDAPLRNPIAAVAGQVYFLRDAWPSLTRLDPATGTVTTLVDVRNASVARFHALSDSPPRLRVHNSSYDLSGPTPQLAVEYVGIPKALIGFGGSDDALAAVSSSARLEEQQRADDGGLRPTGVAYPAGADVVGVDHLPSKQLIAAGSDQTNQLLVFRRGAPTPTHRFPLTGYVLQNSVRFSPDGSRVYALTGSDAGFRLEAHLLAPTFTAATTTTLRPGQASSRLSGSGLGSITAATLGGMKVVIANDGADALEIEVPTLPPPGKHLLKLTGPVGALSIPFVVEQDRVNTVSGRVTRDGLPVAGATVTLVGPRYASASVTTAANGSYVFPEAASAGPGYDLVVTKGTDRVALTGRSLAGAGPWPFDVDLRRPSGSSAVVRRVDLPPGEVRRLVVDPITGWVYVTVGDEVVVFDPSGRRAARIQGMSSADDLQVVGSVLYVMLRHRAEIVAVDLTSSSYPVTNLLSLQTPTTGSMVVVGNRVFFSDGDAYDIDAVASVDLTTRTKRRESNAVARVPHFAALEGAADHFLAWSVGTSSMTLERWSAAAPDLAMVASTPYDAFSGDADVVGSASAGRVWTSKGQELGLATMTPTGTTYDTDVVLDGPDVPRSPIPAVARSAGRGGVLAFGSVVSRQGDPVATHRLGAFPAERSVGLSPDGNTGYVATPGGELVVTDLRPLVTAVGSGDDLGDGPDDPPHLTASGWGLGGASAVMVDGDPVPFDRRDVSTIDVPLAELDDGLHELAITTPWGTSVPVSFRVGPPPAGYAPFASWAAFVSRQFTDLTGKAPTLASRNQWAADLGSGAKAPGDLVEALRRGSDNTTNVDPVARLYRAFLGRAPDASGLRFWIGRKRAGTWSVTKMADSFASSSEFQRKYGTLTNRQFVTRIYTDVLGRPADASGVAFWTGRLDRKVNTRGQVMVGFSESSEYRRKQAENTDVVICYVFLLGRAPTVAETARWVDRQKAGTSPAVLATELLASSDYLAHAGG